MPLSILVVSLAASGMYNLANFLCFFFFNQTSSTVIYTLSLHDALPISRSTSDASEASSRAVSLAETADRAVTRLGESDRKSTRLNSSHLGISYAVFCLKKKKIA